MPAEPCGARAYHSPSPGPVGVADPAIRVPHPEPSGPDPDPLEPCLVLAVSAGLHLYRTANCPPASIPWQCCASTFCVRSSRPELSCSACPPDLAGLVPHLVFTFELQRDNGSLVCFDPDFPFDSPSRLPVIPGRREGL